MIGQYGSIYYVGLDLGQVQDPTAIAAIERAEVQGEFDPVFFAHRREIRISLRYLERVALGTPYPEVIERARRVTEQLRGPERCRLVVDATGVGRPLVDMIRQARLRCELRPVMITGGQEASRRGEYEYVPKLDLIMNLKAMVLTKELRISLEKQRKEALIQEMMEVQVKAEDRGRLAWREGRHDDLVLAVALGCWAVKRDYRGRVEGEYWGGPGPGRQGRLAGI